MHRNGTATRRRLLRIAGSAATAGLAGCSFARSPEVTRGSGTDPTRTGSTRTDAAANRDLPERAAATFRGGLRNQGFHPERTVPDAVGIAWSLPGINKGDHTAAKSSAVRAPDGNLIWPGDTGAVYSVSPGGEVNWAAATDPSAYGIHGTPTVVEDTVYIGAYDGALYAFDLATGRRRWRTRLGDAIGSSPVYYDGTVYLAVEHLPPDGSVFGVSARTGEVEWRSDRPSDHPHSTIGIDLDGGKLVVGSNDGTLYAWDFPSLRDAWRFDTGDAIKGPIATHDGSAFFGSWDHSVYRVDLETGREEWAYATGDMVMSGPAVDPDRGVVYVGSHDDHLHALDADTGERQWAFDADGWIIGCPTVTKAKVLVGSYAAKLWALDRSGHEVWTVPVEGRVTPEPLVVENSVYVAERATDEVAGKAYAVGPR